MRRAVDWGIEPWKMRRMQARAYRLGFRGENLEEALQEIVMDVKAFEYRPERSNGASEATALTAVIDRRLLMIRRQERRYQKRLERLQTLTLAPGEEPSQPSCEEATAAVLDVRNTVAQLSSEDQAICQLLIEGLSIDAIARRLGCGWHTVKRRIERLRKHFEAMGLNDRRDSGEAT